MNADFHETFRLCSKDLAEEQIVGLDCDTTVDSLVSGWLGYAASQGCFDILPHLKQFNNLEDLGSSAYQEAVAKFQKAMAAEIQTVQVTAGPSQKSSETSILLLTAAALGNLDQVRKILELEPNLITQVDTAGNSLLILAAKSGSFAVLEFLLQRPDLDANPCNQALQSVLHFLPIFDDDEARSLALRLVDKGADISQEGLAVAYSTKVSTFSLSIRCCPLVNAIVHKKMALLEALVTASHSENCLFTCRVCEAGSRYRKIIAIAVALHCYEAIEILHQHLKQNGKEKRTKLDHIEVWYQEELVPLQRVPFDGFALRGLDLPEPFLRAIYHGRDHMNALHKTLECLVNGHNKKATTIYEMIQDSIRHDASDALDYLLRIGFSDSNILLFALDTMGDFYNNPIFISIRLGFRSVFERLASSNGAMVIRLQTNRPCSTQCLHERGRLHEINMAQLCLSAAVTAASCDQFFVYVLHAPFVDHTRLEFLKTLRGTPLACNKLHLLTLWRLKLANLFYSTALKK